jgi:uncharacterized repeat protein (TIGR03803 family)
MKRVLWALAFFVTVGSTILLGQAQYKVLWNFVGWPNDGSGPVSNLVMGRNGNLYGTTSSGGTGARPSGTVFELSPNANGGWTETVLYSFCSNFSNSSCLDGAFPQSGLILDRNGNLYGTTTIGGSGQICGFGAGCGGGTVFELSPPLSGGVWTETVLYSFCNNLSNSNCLDGSVPLAQLTFDKLGNLYGTTSTGGTGGTSGGCCVGGTVFELSYSNGEWNETVLHNFCGTGHNGICPDGAAPQAGVALDSIGNLYGTTIAGGSLQYAGSGTVFELAPGTKGWTETVLLGPGVPLGRGGAPLSAVVLDKSGNLYGTFSFGGAGFAGGVFRYSTANKSITTFSFNGGNGQTPSAGVLLDTASASIYGTTAGGGANQRGTIFTISPPQQQSVLYSFCSQSDCTDGFNPLAALVSDKLGNLYGTTKLGGTETNCNGSGCGVVFQITPQTSAIKNPSKNKSRRPHLLSSDSSAPASTCRNTATICSSV